MLRSYMTYRLGIPIDPHNNECLIRKWINEWMNAYTRLQDDLINCEAHVFYLNSAVLPIPKVEWQTVDPRVYGQSSQLSTYQEYWQGTLLSITIFIQSHCYFSPDLLQQPCTGFLKAIYLLPSNTFSSASSVFKVISFSYFLPKHLNGYLWLPG